MAAATHHRPRIRRNSLFFDERPRLAFERWRLGATYSEEASAPGASPMNLRPIR